MIKKKRQRRITVLLIPDDNAEPYSFWLSWTTAKFFFIIGVVVFIHVILGGISYWQYFKVSQHNLELEKSNTQLLEDNKRVYRLAALFEELDKDQGKIMSLLGVESPNGHRAKLETTLNSLGKSSLSGSSPEALRFNFPVLSDKVPQKNEGRTFMLKKQRDRKSLPALPTLLPVEGFLTKQFSRSAWYPFKTHSGIDIAAKRGSVIVAAGDGYVVYSGWHHELGNLIILHHGGTLFSYYGHNDRLLVRERIFVMQGDPIASLGNSGRSSGPHLHFEIWEDGKAINPRQYLLAFKETNQ